MSGEAPPGAESERRERRGEPGAARRRERTTGRSVLGVRPAARVLAPALVTLVAEAGLAAPRPGFVATRRGGSTCRPASSFARSRSRATSRLRACERLSELVARTTGPRRSSSSSRWRGASDEEAATSNRTSTRVSEVLACWPPGPPEPVVRHSSSSRLTTHVGVTRNTWAISRRYRRARVARSGSADTLPAGKYEQARGDRRCIVVEQAQIDRQGGPDES